MVLHDHAYEADSLPIHLSVVDQPRGYNRPCGEIGRTELPGWIQTTRRHRDSPKFMYINMSGILILFCIE